MAKLKHGAPPAGLKLDWQRLDARGAEATADPASPPDTPTASSLLARPGPQQGPFYRFSRPLSQDPNIKPVGNGHQFSYQPRVGPQQLSPRSSASSSSSSSSSSDEPAEDSYSGVESLSDQGLEAHSLPQSPAADASFEEEDGENGDDVGIGGGGGGGDDDDDDSGDGDDDDDDDDDAERASERDNESDHTSDTHGAARATAAAAVECDFIIEDIDPMDSEYEDLPVLLPTEIESNRSRSRSRHKDLDKGMMRDLRNLDCGDEASDGGDGPPGYDDEEEAFYQQRQERRRFRRVSMSSSFGKRTHSELSDSDNDDASLDVNDVGSSARRLRKKQHRGSLFFQDPPEPPIDELEEPNSSEDERPAENPLARELPYYDAGSMEVMEMDPS